MDVKAVETFLNERPDFLEAYVVEHVDLEMMERWMIQKVRRQKPLNPRKGSLSKWKFCVHADKRKMLQDIMESLKNHSTKEQVLWELANCIGSAVGVDGFEVYLLNAANQSHMHRLISEEKAGKVEVATFLATERAAVIEASRLGQVLHLRRSHDKHRFPGGNICSNPEAEYVLYQPITQPDGDTTTVLEMWRLTEKFNDEDEEIIASYMVWGGIALHYAQLYLSMDLQRNLADFLLTVLRSIFQDMVSMDTLVAKVMNFAQKLVDADRASLFLVDAKSKELYASVFDIGVDEDTNSGSGSENSNSKSKENKEIRLPLGTGIAGHVAETGEILNIQDAYKDRRFNHSVDALTGYKTKTILCMPIYIRNVVIGVMQMVNKRNGVFTKDDEKAFEMFAVYCGLALHHAKLYDKIKKSEQKYKVALEVLSYHNTCSEEEIKNARVGLTMPTPCEIALDDFYFSPFTIDDNKKASNAIYMFANLFGLQQFDQMALIKFVLTVKKNYRRVPYHNWTHGFSVANTMYNILKKTKIFSRNEQVALFIAALCHDLDHRGKNNKFMLDTASPLAAIYSTSTLEHHHFNQTVTILQQDGHNIFSMMSNSDYKNILSLVKQCILATDLAMFFPNKTKLGMLLRDKKFEWKKFEHRLLLLALSMTASDLSASAKPWDIQVETVKVIFEEFYEQGDEERAAGREPLPMMDRNRPEEQAASQVGFLSGICLPCYSSLHELIPQTRPLLEMCQRNLARWQQIDEDVKKEMKMKTRTGDTSKRVSDGLFINIDDKKK